MIMKVLLITEKLDKNDEVTSFFHGRLLDFASKCETLLVLVLEKKSHNLPKKVDVLSLGKEKGLSKLNLLFNFYRYIFSHASEYDHVFVYRSPIYIVLGGLFWRLLGKEITLWYSHTYSDWTLRVATFFVNHIITSSENGFPFKTPKLRVISNMGLESYVCLLNENKK
jgi:hypothetical protein